MISFPKFLLAAGILMTAGGVAGAGLTYRDMKTENLLHARTGIIQLNLGKESDWEKDTFTLYQSGDHILYLTTVDAFGGSHTIQTESDDTFNGAFEITIKDPSDKEYLHHVVVADTNRPIRPNNIEWTVLDTLHVSEQFEGVWNIGARPVRTDTNFSNSFTEIFIMPPQHFDIAFYLYKQTFKLVGWALLMLVGFVMIVVGGSMTRRFAEKLSRTSMHP